MYFYSNDPEEPNEDTVMQDICGRLGTNFFFYAPLNLPVDNIHLLGSKEL